MAFIGRGEMVRWGAVQRALLCFSKHSRNAARETSLPLEAQTVGAVREPPLPIRSEPPLPIRAVFRHAPNPREGISRGLIGSQNAKV